MSFLKEVLRGIAIGVANIIPVSYTHLVTPRKSNSDTLRLFLFSYNGTKINSGFAQDATPVSYTHLDVYKRQG